MESESKTNNRQRPTPDSHLKPDNNLLSGDAVIVIMKRRDFFKTAAICGVASTLPAALSQENNSQENGSMNHIPLATSAGTRKGDMLYRTLGLRGREALALYALEHRLV